MGQNVDRLKSQVVVRVPAALVPAFYKHRKSIHTEIREREKDMPVETPKGGKVRRGIARAGRMVRRTVSRESEVIRRIGEANLIGIAGQEVENIITEEVGTHVRKGLEKAIGAVLFGRPKPPSEKDEEDW